MNDETQDCVEYMRNPRINSVFRGRAVGDDAPASNQPAPEPQEWNETEKDDERQDRQSS